MTIKEKNFQARASVIAVRGALVALALAPAAYAADDALRDVTQGKNSVEIGIGNVDKSSAKFGEFNSLNKDGSYLNGGFSLRGGDAYDSGGTTRWRVEATNLGLDTKTLGGEFGEQGRFRINFGYDEIQRNQYNPFQTPYIGAGTTTLTLPDKLKAVNHPAAIAIPTSGIANTAANITTYTNAGIANLLAAPNIQAPNLNPGTLAAPNATASTSAAAANAGLGWLIPANMNSVEIGTQRKKSDLGVDLWISPRWSFKATARNETKDGLKLTGVGSVSTGFGVTLPEPIQYTTNLYSAAFNYADERANFNVGYYGSIFRNGIDTWTADSIWGNNAVQGNVNRMVGAPDNQMQQLKLSGSYAFTKATKLTLAGSTAQNTQNQNFIASGPLWYVPASSANAKVDNTNFLARLTSRATNDLTLLASYRYENRDNKTPYMQTISTGRDALGTAATTSPCGPGALPATAAVNVGGLTCYDNAPINIKQQQIVLQGDYKVARGHALMAGYEWQQIKRTSDQVDQEPFRATETKEQTLRFQYRNSVAQNLNGRIGYDYSQRRHSEFELEQTLGGVLGAAVEPMLPNLYNYMVANRNRDRVRSMLGYQPSDRLSFNAGLSYNNDQYKDDGYGKKSAKSWQLNLDGAFAVSDTAAVGAYYSYDDRKSQMSSLSILRATNVASATTPVPINTAAACKPYPSTASYNAAGAAISYGSPADWASDPCRVWSETQADKVHTFGLSFRSNPAPQWGLSGALTYTYALTPISFSGLQVVSNGLSIGAPGLVNNNLWISTQNMPDSKSKMWDLRLVGVYTIDKSSALRLNYQYRKLTSSDAQWDAYASNPVAIQGYVGTGITSPNYAVNVISANYIYSFK